MAKCGYCNSTVLIAGAKEGEQRFCNEQCRQRGLLMAISKEVPLEQIEQAVREVHQGQCPQCGGQGPVDVSTAYKIWSAVLLTSWKSDLQICCRSCGRKRQAYGLLTSLLAGWWGIPWGLVMTPVQIGRNIVGMTRSYDAYQPSPELENVVRLAIASRLVEQAQAGGET